MEFLSIPAYLWLAVQEMGVREVPGAQHNPRILEYHAATLLKAHEDEVPWCASFVCWCLQKAGIANTQSAWARSYLKWGKPIEHPVPGAVVVLSRDGGGHVAFFSHMANGKWYLLGGNQKDSVCIAPFDPATVLGIRIPEDWPMH